MTDTWYYCTSCRQVFAYYERWHEHANGPFADVMEAEDAMETYDEFLDVPRFKCTYPRQEV